MFIEHLLCNKLQGPEHIAIKEEVTKFALVVKPKRLMST